MIYLSTAIKLLISSTLISILIGISMATSEIIIFPNIILMSIIIITLNKNVSFSTQYVILLSIIFGSLTTEKIGWIMFIFNTIFCISIIFKNTALKRFHLITIILLTFIGEIIYQNFLNFDDINRMTDFLKINSQRTLILQFANSLLTALIIYIVIKSSKKIKNERTK